MSQIKAEYIDHMGDDLRVVNAARVSFNKESKWEEGESCACYAHCECECACGNFDSKGGLSKKDEKLLHYLATHGHFTPFTHPMITLRETVPIFVARQRFKHVVGFTYNEVSRRYVDDEPEFYIPDVWRSRPEGSAKQGSSGEHSNSELIKETVVNITGDALLVYKEMIEAGVAPEQARMVLPQSMTTAYYVTGSLAAFARAYKQRSDNHSQKEIQDLAVEWDKVIRPLFPVSWEVLTN